MDEARNCLNAIQSFLSLSVNQDLIEKETRANKELNKWLGIQEKEFKQKSKAHWIEEGDGNNNYFKCMKARTSSNTISVMTRRDG